jgi:hypothetical protein
MLIQTMPYITTMIFSPIYGKLDAIFKKRALEKVDKKIPGKTWATLLAFFVFSVLIIVLVTNTSILIVDNGLGNSGSAGIALTFLIGGMVGGTLP